MSELRQISRVCTSCLPAVSTLQELYIHQVQGSHSHLQCELHDVKSTVWPQLLQPFTTVKNLYLCKKFVPRIAPALQRLVGANTTDLLPNLENIFLEGLQPSAPLHKGIEKFVSARRLTSHPVAVSRWDKDL